MGEANSGCLLDHREVMSSDVEDSAAEGGMSRSFAKLPGVAVLPSHSVLASSRKTHEFDHNDEQAMNRNTGRI